MKIDSIVQETGPLAENFLPETLHGREMIQKVMLSLLLPATSPIRNGDYHLGKMA